MRLIPFVFLLATSQLWADEVRLTDGRVLVGEVVRSGDRVVVRTRDGEVEVGVEEIESIRTDGELRAELRRLAKERDDGAYAQLQLARLARRYGLEKEMWGFLDEAVEGLPDIVPDAAVQRLAQQLLADLEPELLDSEDRQLDPEHKVRALIRLARPGAGPGKCAAVAAVLAGIENADEELLKQARRGLLDEQRVAANEALLRRGDEAGRRAAFLNMVIDGDRDARRRIAALAGRLAPSREALAFVAPAFLHDSPPIRMQAAEAVAAIGDMELGAPLLAVVGPYAGVPRKANGGNVGVRAHMQATLQTSYIRDFDVEIAQAAAVANPVIDRVTSGVVLDVKVAAVISQRVEIEDSYRRALRELLGADPGPDPKSWTAFVAAHRDTADDEGS